MTSDRRQFLNRVLTGAVGVIVAYIVYPVLRFLDPPLPEAEEKTRVFVTTTDEMGLNTAKFFRFLNRAAVLVRLPDGKYKSLSAKCTDLGCTVAFRPAGDYFHCNCHGSEFSINGRVLRGPAARALEEYDVSIVGSRIYVSVPRRTV